MSTPAKHRADLSTDWCEDYAGFECHRCHTYVGTHRAEVAA